MAARMIHGTLYVSAYTATANPGEYTFTGAVFDNQADATGDGALGIQVGFILYVPAVDTNTFMPVPGIGHRYRITAISAATYSTLSATILWDEDGTEVDAPQDDSYAILSEDTTNLHYGLIPSSEVYANIPGGLAENSFSNDIRKLTDKLSVTGPQGVTGPAGLSGETGVQGVTGILGINGETGVQGVTGVRGVTGILGIDGQTGATGVTGLQGVTGGVGINYASQLPLGTPPDGTYADGIFPWTNSTYTATALDDVNELLLAISPAPPGALSGDLVLSNTTKYTAILPTGLESSQWYQDSKVAGSTITDYIVDPSYNLTNANTATTFKAGSTFGGDEGTVKHVEDGVVASSRDMTQGVGTTGTIQITSLADYNTIWRKANARINYTQSVPGFKRHSMRYTVNASDQDTNDAKFWYDNSNLTPVLSSSAVAENTLSSSRYLSGIRYYYTGDTFDFTCSVANIANQAIRPTNPLSYSMPGLNNVNVAIAGGSFNYDQTYDLDEVAVALNASNVYNINARATYTGRKPSGTSASSTTVTENRLVNTYSPGYSSNGDIRMFDEEYRWQLSTDYSSIPANYSNPTGDWTSSDPLTNGNLQLYNSVWSFPSINFTSGYLPAQGGSTNYSTFSGVQQALWMANIGVAHSSMRIVFTGIVYTDISPAGTGNLNLEIILPTSSIGKRDAGRAFGDGNGCRVGTSSGSTLDITFGTGSSSDSSGVVFILVTMRNASAAQASRMVITGT